MPPECTPDAGVHPANSRTATYIRIAYERGYRVTDDGRLFNPKGEQVTPNLSGQRWGPRFSLNGLRHLVPSGVATIPVHRFAAYCFYGEEMFDPALEVRHLNANLWDFSRRNIALGTPSENAYDMPVEVRTRRARIARLAQPSRSANACFSDDTVREIRRRLRAGEMGKALAREYGVCPQTISNIRRRNLYQDVED